MQNDFPVTIVIFGGTGDLSRKKLIPALFDLYKNDFLKGKFEILGVSRKEITDVDFQNFMRESLSGKEGDIESFINRGKYCSADISDADSFNNLVNFLAKQDEQRGVCANKIFYLAISPSLYEQAFNKLHDSGLMIECVNPESIKSWSRILVEKPFGNDTKHAEDLDKMLGNLFQENQIFRIDHYLAKETLQNILTFRFGNAIFEPIWNSNSIEKIEVKMYESFDIGNRGNLYDGVGALRDVGQNHLLQMLALIAMEDPKDLSAEMIRGGRAAVLSELRVATDASPRASYTRAQYIGFTETPGINPNSETETFFSIKAEIDNDRWRGVPFYLSSGKALNETMAEISVYFKERNSSICPPDDTKNYQNVINFRIQPKEGIGIQFWSKKPGFDYAVNPTNLKFLYSENESRIPDAYERVLYDCIQGDQTLFVSTKEVIAQWNFIDSVIKEWVNTPILKYEKGIDPTQIGGTI
jgi:glucose-6-phosphate 1-dehydrogenase